MREGAIGIDFGTTNSSIAYANNSDEHPNLIIWKPSACTGCAGAIFADFTWQASREEYERALGFDFSCITRFHECRTPDEFLPTAAQVLKVDEENRLGEMVGKIPCDTRCARILGRDSDFVEVVRIKRVNRSDGKITIADYELMKALKGKTLNLRDLYYTKQFVDEVEVANTGYISQPLLQIGGERIVYFSEILQHPTAWSDCAIMAATQQNLGRNYGWRSGRPLWRFGTRVAGSCC